MPGKKSKKKTTGLKKHLLNLYLLTNTNQAQRKKILEKASQGLVRAICQCTRSLISGEAKISLEERKKLLRHKKKLKKLMTKGPIASKQALVQKGGFAWLLPMLAPLASSLIGGLIGGK